MIDSSQRGTGNNMADVCIANACQKGQLHSNDKQKACSGSAPCHIWRRKLLCVVFVSKPTRWKGASIDWDQMHATWHVLAWRGQIIQNAHTAKILSDHLVDYRFCEVAKHRVVQNMQEWSLLPCACTGYMALLNSVQLIPCITVSIGKSRLCMVETTHAHLACNKAMPESLKSCFHVASVSSYIHVSYSSRVKKAVAHKQLCCVLLVVRLLNVPFYPIGPILPRNIAISQSHGQWTHVHPHRTHIPH